MRSTLERFQHGYVLNLELCSRKAELVTMAQLEGFDMVHLRYLFLLHIHLHLHIYTEHNRTQMVLGSTDIKVWMA